MTNEEPQSPIEGKVAAFVNDRELVINRGSADGVEIGQRYAVLLAGGVPIPNPDGGQPIGTLDVAKTVIKIVRIAGEHAAVGRTFKTIKGRQPIIPGEIAITGWTKGTEDRVETLDVNEFDAIGKLRGFDRQVKVGDPVRLTTSDEFLH